MAPLFNDILSNHGRIKSIGIDFSKDLDDGPYYITTDYAAFSDDVFGYIGDSATNDFPECFRVAAHGADYGSGFRIGPQNGDSVGLLRAGELIGKSSEYRSSAKNSCIQLEVCGDGLKYSDLETFSNGIYSASGIRPKVVGWDGFIARSARTPFLGGEFSLYNLNLSSNHVFYP